MRALLLAMAVLLVSSTERVLRAEEATADPKPIDAREHAQPYVENDKPRRAVAILADFERVRQTLLTKK